MSDSRHRQPVPVAAAFALLLLVVAAAGDLAVQAWDAGRMPPPEVVRAANRVIADGFVEGDVVRVRPLWFADGRLGLDTLPILAGDELDEYERHRYRRMWLAYPLSHANEVDADRDWLADAEVVFDRGGYRVELGTTTTVPPVVWDGFDAIEQAAVSRRNPDGVERDCSRWTRGAWHCGFYNEFIYVGPSIREMGDEEPHACIMANPPENGDTWMIRWDDVPTAPRFRMRAGHTFMAVRSGRGAPVDIAVFVDDEEAVRDRFELDDQRWAEVSFALPTRETVDLRVEIHADDHFDRFFCFRPQVVEVP